MTLAWDMRPDRLLTVKLTAIMLPYVLLVCGTAFTGGILQVHRRISSPDSLAWTEQTRGMFGGMYPSYAFGDLADRCFLIARR